LAGAHLGLAEYLARRFANRGEPLDALVQVASRGLTKAVDRFDPARGVAFSTYATHTIVGELKRHFRDKGWAGGAPPRMQQLYLSLGQAVASLSQELGRSPTIAELAAEVQVSEEEVLEALEAGQTYRSSSPDEPADRERSVFHLRFVEGLTKSEIATRLELPPLQVSRLLARGAARLRAVAETPTL
jgi:RNA polymerase sigma-B factor